MVVVLAPGEDVGPVGKVIRQDRKSVPPGLHDGLHVVEGVGPAEVGGLESLVDLVGFLEFHYLLGGLEEADVDV